MANKITAYCHECEKDTNQGILFSKNTKKDISFDEEGNDVFDSVEHGNYKVVQCLGCDAISFIERLSYSDEMDEDGKLIIYENIYPQEEEFDFEDDDFFLQEDEVKALPLLVKRLYIELTEAFTNDLNILAGMGLRSLIEAICIHQKIQGKNLEAKIENLHKAGYISQKQIPILHKLRKLGNSTVHTIEKPSAGVLGNALTVINHTLKSVYYLPKVEAKIKDRKKV